MASAGSHPEIATAREQRGQLAWQHLLATGGLFPIPSFNPKAGLAEPVFIRAMGEYEPDRVKAILTDALPNLPAERSWPWVARAAYCYETLKLVGATLSNRSYKISDIVADISRSARALDRSFQALDEMGLLSAHAVGDANWYGSVVLRDAINNCLGGPTRIDNPTVGATALRFRLRSVIDACDTFEAKDGSGRRRGVSDPNLPLLVLDLSFFWIAAKGKNPSAAKPSRRDDGESPFVRLVDACAKLGGGCGATRKQVSTCLKNLPKAF